MDQKQTIDVSLSAQTEDNQKEDPFAISVGPIPIPRSLFRRWHTLFRK